MRMLSKLTSKSQIVVPKAVRQQLGLKPGDRVRYRVRRDGVMLEKVSAAAFEGDPFVVFDEWASEADDKAFADL